MGVPSTRPPTPPPRQALVQVDTGQAEWQGVFSRAASTRVQAHPGARGSGHSACGRAPSGDPSPALRVPWELYRPPWPPHPLRSFSAWPTPAGKRDQDTSLPSQGGRWETAGTRPGSNLNQEAQPARGGTVGASGRPARTGASPGPAVGRRHPTGPMAQSYRLTALAERGLTPSGPDPGWSGSPTSRGWAGQLLIPGATGAKDHRLDGLKQQHSSLEVCSLMSKIEVLQGRAHPSLQGGPFPPRPASRQLASPGLWPRPSSLCLVVTGHPPPQCLLALPFIARTLATLPRPRQSDLNTTCLDCKDPIC